MWIAGALDVEPRSIPARGLAFDTTFGDGSRWLAPLQVLAPRFVRFNAGLDLEGP